MSQIWSFIVWGKLRREDVYDFVSSRAIRLRVGARFDGMFVVDKGLLIC